MRKEKIFCFGRPIIDIVATIESRFLEEVGIKGDVSGQISVIEMEVLLKQLSKKADYIFVSAGGVECNVAINSAILGIPSVIVGSIGDDYLHLMYRDSLGIIEGLDLGSMQVIASNSAVIAVIWVINENGETKRIKVFNYGASEFLPWDDSIKAYLKETTVFFSSLFSANTPKTEPVWRKAVETAKNFGMKVIISLGGIDTISRKKLAKMMRIVAAYGDIIFSNEMECNLLQQEYNQDISSIFPKAELLIVTKEERGCSIFCKGEEIPIQIPQEKIPAPDEQIFEIGAGDAFCAGYIFASLKGSNPEQAGRFATETSLIKIRHPKSHLAKTSLSDLANIKRISFQ